ncbi:MAG: polysaccharide biosynthesis/export family protein [Bryobacteraceae bacterium]|nr:polysaccharide biosynthesis/export family protein [Bryobacteraceae bacterium]MDW8379455.1 polysaccharide biosynthesis/export family protein [Bryobacterales bacterium]
MHLLIGVALAVSSGLLAQGPVADSMPNLPAQRIGPHDLLAISVYGAPELSRSARVGADGLIRLPMLRQKLKADGLLPSELELAIAAAIQSENLLVDPVVTVTVAEYHSRPISVVGAVRKPLTFQAMGSSTLLDALTRAEGLTPEAGPEILVSRSQPGPDGAPATIVQRIPVRALIHEADPEMNIQLYGGEQIRVPEVGKIYVVGNVRKPGAFPVQDASGTTLLKVLALTEGLLPFAAKQAYIYRQPPNSTVKHEIPVELQKIVERKAPDIPLEVNDILYIPDNKGKRLTVTTLERLAGFGSATASGIIIWRR